MHRWKFTALAAAAFASAALTSHDAYALTLGRMDVQSALGQPLRAQIDIPEATPAELDALQVEMASPQQFRAYGVDYSNAAQAVQVTVQRRSDGTPYLSLSSSAPIDDPFVDLVLSANWNAGSVLRSYTLLLDPSSTSTPAVEVAQAPQVPAPTAAEVGRTYSSAPIPPAVEATPPAAAPVPAAPAASTNSATSTPAAQTAPAAASVRVRRGDTAGRLAQNSRHNGVSLDQMLVAMLRHNPDAFINGNVNRMRAGAVLQMPTREQAQSTSAPQARQIMAAQSRDFSAFRRSLAQRTPRVQVAEQTRTATGRVQAQVADSAPQAAPDKLTLSKGAVQTPAQAEEQIARDKQNAAQDNRMQELQRNLQELKTISNTTPAATAAAGSAAATAAPAADAATGGVAVTSDTLAAAAQNAPTPEAPATAAADAIAEAPNNADNSTANSAATDGVVQDPATAAGEGAVDANIDNEPVVNPVDAAAAAAAAAAPEAPAPNSWTDSPWLPVGGALAAVLLGLLGYGLWKRRQATAAPVSSFMQAAKEAGAVSRDEDPALDAPSAAHGTTLEHADAYLSYGQDAQAEATLHEVLRRDPQELAAWVKLCDLHAKHHDLVQLEVAARSLLAASKGEGPEWEHVLQLGRQMDPRNPFYAVVQPATPTAAPAAGSFADALRNTPDAPAAAAAAGSTASFVQQRSANNVNDMDADFDLPDLDLPNNANTRPTAAAPDTRNLSAASTETWNTPPAAPAPAAQAAASNNAFDLDLDLDMLDLPTAQAPITPKAAPTQPVPTLPTLDELHFDVTPAAPAPTPQPSASARVAAASAPAPVAPASAPAAARSAPGASDLGSLDLDTNLEAELPPVDTTDQHLPPPTPPVNEHLATKLDLAMEFNSIGDSEGARALIEEVLAEATGPLQQRAQQLLRQIA